MQVGRDILCKRYPKWNFLVTVHRQDVCIVFLPAADSTKFGSVGAQVSVNRHAPQAVDLVVKAVEEFLGADALS
jgi:hypothetical protein